MLKFLMCGVSMNKLRPNNLAQIVLDAYCCSAPTFSGGAEDNGLLPEEKVNLAKIWTKSIEVRRRAGDLPWPFPEGGGAGIGAAVNFLKGLAIAQKAFLVLPD